MRGNGSLLQRQGLDVGVLRAHCRQRVDKLNLPAGDFVLDRRARKVAQDESTGNGVLADVHELELERGLDRKPVPYQLAQDLFVAFNIGPKSAGPGRQRVVRRENLQVSGISDRKASCRERV